MKAVNLVFPHQLFAASPLLENGSPIYLIEEHLFFKHFHFHKQKIAFHRASMKCYEAYLKEKGREVIYIDATNPLSDIREFGSMIASNGIDKIYYIDPTDDWLLRRIKKLENLARLKAYENPSFINTTEDLTSFFKKDKKTFFQTSFYKQQRKKLSILLEEDGKPVGGDWTYDKDNRKKYPKNKQAPMVQFPEPSAYWDEAVRYTQTHFASNPGALSKERFYPINFDESETWLDQFLTMRFFDFGPYEDAIVREQLILNHSLLSPLINAGLLLPLDVVNKSMSFAKEYHIPINSLEGFVRQIIGWREFIRGMYECKGRMSRRRNFWNFHRKIPASFYTGTTGIPPIDTTIKKVLKTGYCHHIERLMLLGNFMLLCEFDPDEVYRWFMELFIDAYDWVMVPNVYGMTQFADGGTFATKPYIGGANYVKKMSNYPSGEWEATWNGLFWRFIHEHEEVFSKNPRMSMMVHTKNKMAVEKLEAHLKNANDFLDSL